MCGTGTIAKGKRVAPKEGKRSAKTGGAAKASRRKDGKPSSGDDSDGPVVVRAPSASRVLWEKGLPLSDLVIEAVSPEGKVTEIRAHRCFLAAVSNYFKAALFGEGAPAKPATGPARLRIEDVDVDALRECIRWCYVETWSEDSSMVVRCKVAAKRFDVPGLEFASCQAARTSLTPAGMLTALAAATNAGDKELMDAAVDGAAADPEGTISNPAFLELPAQAVEAIVRCDRMATDEVDIVKTVLAWADRRASQRGAAQRRGARGAAASGAGGGGGGYVGPLSTGEELLKELCPTGAAVQAAGAAAASAASAAAAGEGAAAASAAAATSGTAAAPAADAEDGESAFSYTASIAGTTATGAGARPGSLPSRPVDILHALRLPLLKLDELIKIVKPAGVLNARDFAALVSHSYKTAPERRLETSVAGFSNERRAGTSKSVIIHMWGGGGACGQDSGPQFGGAGGYLAVRYELVPGDDLTVHVGDGGYADAAGSNDALSTKAWPNGGCGGYNWVSGGGGGATYVTSSMHEGEVVAGAGGGGGGPANGTWSSAGGGGGGTKDGRVGEGGHGGNQSRRSPTMGTDGGGNGGKPDGSGSAARGASPHGAGGGPGGSSRSDGGDGGASSNKWAEEMCSLTPTNHAAVESPTLKVSAGGGGGPRSPKARGAPGLCILEIESTGERIEFKFKGEPEVYVAE